MSDRQIDLKQKTIIRLIRENENLHKELLRAKENARVRGANILQEAIRIIDDAKIEAGKTVIFAIGEQKQFVDSYLDQLQGGNSTRGSASPPKDSTRSTHPSSNYSTSRRDQTIRNTDTQWMNENQSCSRSMGNTSNYRPISPRKDKSGPVLDESGFTDGPSTSGSDGTRLSSLHESMLRSTGNATSTWDTQSSYGKESLAKKLFPRDLNRDNSSQLRPWTTTQHVTLGEDGTITQRVYNGEHPNSPITTKMLLGDNGIEIVRTQSPMQSEDGFTVGSHQFKSPAASSKLIQSPLKDQSRISDMLPTKENETSERRDMVTRVSDYSPDKQAGKRESFVTSMHGVREKEFTNKRETPMSDTKGEVTEKCEAHIVRGPSYTVWEIPNDNFSGHKLNKTPFYGFPVDTSTPIRRTNNAPASPKPSKDEQKVDTDKFVSATDVPYTSQLSEQRITNQPVTTGGYTTVDVSEMYDHAVNRDRSEVKPKQTDDDKSDGGDSVSAEHIYSGAPTSAQEDKPKNLDLTSLLQNIQLSKRLLGEIAFQLDRRIINYVFGGKHDKRQKKRLYGYCVQNIESMIRKHAIDHTTGHIDAKKMHALERRYNYILNSVRPLGYNIVQHADFSMDMVNKYGLLPLRPGRNSANTLNPTDLESLHKLVASLSAPHEAKDMTIMVDCLALLARDDGKPMVFW